MLACFCFDFIANKFSVKHTKNDQTCIILMHKDKYSKAIRANEHTHTPAAVYLKNRRTHRNIVESLTTNAKIK